MFIFVLLIQLFIMIQDLNDKHHKLIRASGRRKQVTSSKKSNVDVIAKKVLSGTVSDESALFRGRLDVSTHSKSRSVSNAFKKSLC